jgi:hypothetical protein
MPTYKGTIAAVEYREFILFLHQSQGVFLDLLIPYSYPRKTTVIKGKE